MANTASRLIGKITSRARAARKSPAQPPPSETTTVTEVEIRDIRLRVRDFSTSIIARAVAKELINDDYNIEIIPFQAGDVVLDLGANVGIVSMYIAKKHPALTVHAFEPIPENYDHLVENLQLNNVVNVIPHKLAITKDGRRFDMIVHLASNSGGATGWLADMRLPGHTNYQVESWTLDRVFEEYEIPRCRFLKIDCEGAEHEILLNARSLERVEYLSGEFHINQHLQSAGYSIDALVAHCQKFITPEKIRTTAIRMAE